MPTYLIVQPHCGPRRERVVLREVEANSPDSALDAFARANGFADHADASSKCNVGDVIAEEKPKGRIFRVDLDEATSATER